MCRHERGFIYLFVSCAIVVGRGGMFVDSICELVGVARACICSRDMQWYGKSWTIIFTSVSGSTATVDGGAGNKEETYQAQTRKRERERECCRNSK